MVVHPISGCPSCGRELFRLPNTGFAVPLHLAGGGVISMLGDHISE